MRKGILVLSLAMAAIFCGCAPSKPTLHLFTWPEYISPDVAKAFEKKFDCKVSVDIFDSNESMLAKIKAGATGYDILVPSSYMVQQLALEGMIIELDHSKLPNVDANIDPVYEKAGLKMNGKPLMTYCVPLVFTYTGIAWNKRLVPEEPVHSWGVFDNPALAGRMTLLADIRETIGSALIYNGFSINSTNAEELAKARDTILGWKKNVAKFDSEQYKSGIENAEFLLVQGYSGDLGQAQLENEDIEFFIPEEGFSLACDEMCIPTTAPNKELALEFINFIHDGEISAKNIQYNACRSPNKAATEVLKRDAPEILANKTIYVDDEILEKGQVLEYIGDGLELFTKMWDEIRSGDAK